uniref:olfactory receptor 10H28-like n=1 Tax=Myxine glutinosa TaxID=7769 RepID=UPI00358DE94A
MNQTEGSFLPLTVTFDSSVFSGMDNSRRDVVVLSTVFMCLATVTNLAVIGTCCLRGLHKPVLLHIAASCVADVFWGILGIVAHLTSVLVPRRRVSFSTCLLEMFWMYFTLLQHFLNNILMYVDRHWAIFYPYRYVHLVAQGNGAAKLVAFVWLLGITLGATFPAVATMLLFCDDSIVIYDVTCHVPIVAKSACRNVRLPSVYSTCVVYTVVGLTALTAAFSTCCIVRKCRRDFPSKDNRKALHTCFTQLAVCSVHFTCMLFVAAFKRFIRSPALGSVLDLIVIVTPAAVNPFIFGLRTQEIRASFASFFKSICSEVSKYFTKLP